jgi:hypothetical protein
MRQLAQRRRRDVRLPSRKPAKSTSTERDERKLAANNPDGPGESSRVVIVIVALALAFIAVITYFVAHMPGYP